MAALRAFAAALAAVALGLSACAEEAETAMSDPADIDQPGFSPAERALELALADVSGMTDNLALLVSGEIDGETAGLRLVEIRDHIKTFAPDWRAATPEARAGAREVEADAWASIVGRYDGAAAAFAAIDGPKPWQVAIVLDGPHPLAEFLREPPILTVAGVFRDSFETSAFHLMEQQGVWWANFDDEPWEELRAEPGFGDNRGSVTFLSFEADGWLEQEPGQRYGHLSAYDGEFHVEAVRNVRRLTNAEYEAALAAALAEPGETEANND